MKILSAAVLLPFAVTLVFTPTAANASTSVPEEFTLVGGGWGHGVGMSQYGAYGMALEGHNAEQILEHYYNPAQVTETSSYASSDITVQLIGGQTTTTLSPKNGQLRVKFDGQTIASSAPVKFDISGSKVKVMVNGKDYSTSSPVAVEWQNTRYWTSGMDRTTVTIPKANGGGSTGEYRHGKMTVKLTKGKINVLNHLRLNDEYLYGLAEVPSSWPSAALQSQAIAGRTYAVRNMASIKADCECNVYDEVQSQKFTGWSKENEGNGSLGKKWVDAVNATQTKKSGVPSKAKVVTYNGAYIDAVYSSSTGGKTRSAKSVWGNEHAYLQSRDDHWAVDPRTGNPNREWTGRAGQAAVSKAYGLPDVYEIKVSKSADGTIASSTAVSSKGQTATITGTATRTLFGAKSQWVYRIDGGAAQLPATGDYPVTSTAANVQYFTNDNLNIRTGPSTSYAAIILAKKASTVITTGKQSGVWLEVKQGNVQGWVNSAYLTKVVSPPFHNCPFADIAPGANFFTSIKWMKDSGITGGYTDGTFRPGKQITRGEFASFLYRYSGDTQNVTAKPFKDVPATNAHAKAITWMKAEGLTKGYSDGSFGLNKAITRGEVSAMLYRYAGDSSYNAPNVSQFKDLTTKSSYYKDISWLSAQGLINGYADGTFKSSRAVTRGETSKFLYALDQQQKNSYITNANVNMRLGAGTGHAVITVVKAGTKVTGTGKTSSGWVQVKVGSKTGWIAGSYLSPQSSPNLAKANVSVHETTVTMEVTADINVREKAFPVADKVFSLSSGDTVEVQSVENGWAKVTSGGQTGWVSSAYLR